jgi:hypothetical protein
MAERKNVEQGIAQRQARAGAKSESKSTESFKPRAHKLPNRESFAPPFRSDSKDRAVEYSRNKALGPKVHEHRGQQSQGVLTRARADASAGRKTAAKARLRVARLTGQPLRPSRPQDRVRKG